MILAAASSRTCYFEVPVFWYCSALPTITAKQPSTSRYRCALPASGEQLQKTTCSSKFEIQHPNPKALVPCKVSIPQIFSFLPPSQSSQSGAFSTSSESQLWQTFTFLSACLPACLPSGGAHMPVACMRLSVERCAVWNVCALTPLA